MLDSSSANSHSPTSRSLSRRAEDFILDCPGPLFGLAKAQSLGEKEQKELAFFSKIEKTETKRVLFLFKRIVSLMERFFFKSSETVFLDFYQRFYEKNEELGFQPGLEYKITGKDFYKVFLHKHESGSQAPRVVQFAY